MQALLARRRNLILCGVLVLAQIVLVGQQIHERPLDARLSYWSSALFRPFQTASQWLLQGVRGAWSGYVGLVDTAAENRRLDAEAARLRLENHYLQQQLLQVRGREALDEFRASLASLTLGARVIAHGPSRNAREVFLNRGRDDGVRPGMAVLVSAGIIGKVEAAYGASSMVVLANDVEAGAGVVLGQSGAPGVLRGTGGLLCRLDYVPPHLAVGVGEQVHTSGLDGIFPPGMPVGEVVSVGTTPESHAILVRLHADLDRVRDVAVVLRAEHELLPAAVQRVLARLPAFRQVRPDGGKHTGGLLDGPADRIKLTYRRTLASQEKKIGLLGDRPPDFSPATDSLRAMRSASGVASGETE